MMQAPEQACPSCGKLIDAYSYPGPEEHRARPGDISICMYCGHLMAFANDLTKRELTDEEAHAIAGDPRILALQRARKEVMK